MRGQLANGERVLESVPQLLADAIYPVLRKMRTNSLLIVATRLVLVDSFLPALLTI